MPNRRKRQSPIAPDAIRLKIGFDTIPLLAITLDSTQPISTDIPMTANAERTVRTICTVDSVRLRTAIPCRVGVTGSIIDMIEFCIFSHEAPFIRWESDQTRLAFSRRLPELLYR